MVANAAVQLVLEAVRAAVRSVAKMEGDYSFWMSQYKEQTRALAARRAAGDGESAAQELKETKEALNLASKEVANARAELSNARQFFLQYEGSNASISSGSVINCENGVQVGREGGRETMERFSPVQRKEESTAMGHIEGDSGTESEDGFSSFESGFETAQVPPPIHFLDQVDEQKRSSSTHHQQELDQSITRQDSQLRSMPIRDVQQRSLAQSSLKQKHTPSRTSPQQQEAPATSVKRQKTRSTRRPSLPHRSTYERKFQWKEDGEMHHFPEEMSIPLVPLPEA